MSHWNPGVTVDESQDHLCTLLDVLAEIYEYRHDLILFGQPPEAILKFIGWVPDSDLLHSSPEVLYLFIVFSNLYIVCIFSHCPIRAYEIIPQISLLVMYIVFVLEVGEELIICNTNNLDEIFGLMKHHLIFVLILSQQVLNSFVLLWSAIATGSEGAKRIHNQLYLGQKEGFHTISRGYERCQWGFIISTLIRFTMAVTGSDHVGAKQVGKDDLKGLLAYLRLIR